MTGLGVAVPADALWVLTRLPNSGEASRRARRFGLAASARDLPSPPPRHKAQPP
jgi:hypothetical protein